MSRGAQAVLVAISLAAAGCASAAVPAMPPMSFAPEEPAAAGGPGPAESAPSGWKGERLDRWEFSVTPFLWLTGVDSTMAIDGKKVSSSSSFQDVLPNLDLAAMAHLEARRGPWAIFGDGVWFDLSSDSEHPTLGPTTASLQDFTGTGAVAYRFFQGPVHTQGGPGFEEVLTLEGYGGARYTRLDARINPKAFGSVSDSLDWIDGIVGLRARLDMSPRFALKLRGDGGGFQGNTDNSWFFMGGVEWRPSASFSAEVGYAVLTQKYRNGDDTGDFYVRVKLSGPVVGVTFRF